MNNALLEKIQDIAAAPGIAPEALLLLKMAAEAQKTGRMPDLPIALQPMPMPLPVAMPYSADYTGCPPPSPTQISDPLYNYAVKHTLTGYSFRYRGLRDGMAVAWWYGETLFDPADLIVIATNRKLSEHLTGIAPAPLPESSILDPRS